MERPQSLTQTWYHPLHRKTSATSSIFSWWPWAIITSVKYFSFIGSSPSRTTPIELASPKMGSRVRWDTSSKVGGNSSQEQRKYVALCFSETPKARNHGVVSSTIPSSPMFYLFSQLDSTSLRPLKTPKRLAPHVERLIDWVLDSNLRSAHGSSPYSILILKKKGEVVTIPSLSWGGHRIGLDIGGSQLLSCPLKVEEWACRQPRKNGLSR